MSLTRTIAAAANWGVVLVGVVGFFGCARQSGAPKSAQPTIVFVCEHGAAKSVIAAAYFNQLAAERHLNFHAVARGLTPQPDLSTATVAGLNRDGVPFSNQKPQPLNPEEARTALRVVAFCPMPQGIADRQQKVQSFDVTAPADGYDAARDAILAHVRVLVDQLATQCQQNGGCR